MKRVVSMLVITLWLGCLSVSAYAQSENLSAGHSWGVGIRFLPNVLYPPGPMETDQALGTLVAAQLWITDTVGFEAGGWLSGFSDQWSERSFVNLVGGLIFKVLDSAQGDLYIAGRGIHLESVSRNQGYCCPRCVDMPCKYQEKPAKDKEDDQTDPAKLWAYSENRTSTLAFEGMAGIEWSFSRNLTLDFEFGMIFAQVVGINIPASPEEKSTNYSSTSFGMTLHLGLYYYFVPATKP
ncbi:hypothetical protein HY230_03265 [Candidatus Acetothermia bacterium]|nr:hypothetical protein [Candidatus Acetothermia bacterium]